MSCPKCSEKLPSFASKFCLKCGNKLAGGSSAPSTPTKPTTSTGPSSAPTTPSSASIPPPLPPRDDVPTPTAVPAPRNSAPQASASPTRKDGTFCQVIDAIKMVTINSFLRDAKRFLLAIWLRTPRACGIIPLASHAPHVLHASPQPIPMINTAGSPVRLVPESR